MNTKSNQSTKKSPASSLSATKMLFIMEYLAECGVPVRLQDISERLDMAQPSVLRYLNSLLNSNYVYQDEETLRYGLTWKIRRLGNLMDTHLSIRSIVGPFLNTLAHKFNLGTCLAKEKNYEIIYLDFIDKPEGKLNLHHIGVKAPLYATGSGKVILSHFQQWQINEMISKMGLQSITKKTIVDKQDLLQEIEKVRRLGYAIDDEECESNNRCVSVPLYDYTDTIFAAISAFDTVDNLPFERINEEILPVMQEMSRIISLRMGCSLFDVHK